MLSMPVPWAVPGLVQTAFHGAGPGYRKGSWGEHNMQRYQFLVGLAAAVAAVAAEPHRQPTKPVLAAVSAKDPGGTGGVFRGPQDCDGNGTDDTIDRSDDLSSPVSIISSFAPCVATTISTSGSGFDTELALFDSEGNLLFVNDDVETGVLWSRFRGPLSPGSYRVAIAGFNAVFSDGFSVDFSGGGCPAAGSLVVTYANPNINQGQPTTVFGDLGPLGSGRVQWIAFNVPSAFEYDFDTDGVCDGLQFADDFGRRFNMGVVAEPGDPITFDTAGSAFGNEIAIYDVDGVLVDRTLNGEVADNMLVTPLPAGTYFLGFAAYRTVFADGPDAWIVEPLGGDLAVGVSSSTRLVTTGDVVPPGRSRWFEFSVAPSVGPDCDFDGVPDSAELDCNNDGTPDDCQTTELLALGGVAGDSSAPIDINTNGSDFDTEIAVWDFVTGELIAENDDVAGSSNLQSQIVRTYEPGEYLLGIAGFNTLFSDFSPDFQFGGISVNGGSKFCAASGNAVVSIGANTGNLGIGSGRVQLVPFTVEPGPEPCGPADVAMPFGTLDIDDVLTFLDAFAVGGALADLSPPIGVFNIDDVLSFLDAFAGGCP